VRALQVTELSGPDGLQVVEVAEPTDDGAGVVLDVRAVGLSFPDLLRSQGLYQEKLTPPYTLGAEVAGVVIRAPASTGFQQGDRVAGTVAGAAAERAIAEPGALIRLSADLSFEQGAALPLNYRTAILGLELRGRMRSGETVLVHGAAGGTGTAAIQIALAAGCRVIGVVSSDHKERVAREAGAEFVLRSDGPWKDEALQLCGGQGVDIVWDPVGGDRVLDTIRVLAPFGRWVVLGFTGGPIPSVPLNRVLLRNIDVVGTYIGGYIANRPDRVQQLNQRLAELVAGGHARPVVGSIHQLEHGADALREIESRRAVGKVVIAVAS
jgi:NADPH2:quinone reductase